jgi:hypothetical protein
MKVQGGLTRRNAPRLFYVDGLEFMESAKAVLQTDQGVTTALSWDGARVMAIGREELVPDIIRQTRLDNGGGE